MRTTFALAVSLLLPIAINAQDERRVSSPNGQVEFRIRVAQPNDGGLGQLAYQVYYGGKAALDDSWMGLDIYNQQPLLGAKPGLTHSSTDTTTPGPYHSMLLEYLQDGYEVYTKKRLTLDGGGGPPLKGKIDILFFDFVYADVESSLD